MECVFEGEGGERSRKWMFVEGWSWWGVSRWPGGGEEGKEGMMLGWKEEGRYGIVRGKLL
jgi:hypothetical protein